LGHSKKSIQTGDRRNNFESWREMSRKAMVEIVSKQDEENWLMFLNVDAIWIGIYTRCLYKARISNYFNDFIRMSKGVAVSRRINSLVLSVIKA